MRFAEVHLVHARVMMLNDFSHLSSLVQVDHEQFLLIKVLCVNIFNFSLSFGGVDFTTIWRLVIIINIAAPHSQLVHAVRLAPLVETAIFTRWLTRLNVPHRMLGVVSLKIRNLLIVWHQL